MIDYNDFSDGKRWDFGDDADVNLPDDPQFDAWIEQAAPMLNVPPATPRADMWDAIQAKQAAPAAPVATVIPIRRARRWHVPAALAAALLLGIAIDRAVVRSSDPSVAGPLTPRVVASTPPAQPQPAAPVATKDVPSTPRAQQPAPQVATRPSTPSAAEPSDNGSAKLYRLAAVQTLSQAEALLTAYRASGVAERDPEAARHLGTWSRQVLSSTRLLIDSPAGDDPSLRSLLNDLELVLVQIIRVSGTPLDASERALIDEALRNRDLLPRIRTAVPAGVAGAASSD